AGLPTGPALVPPAAEAPPPLRRSMRALAVLLLLGALCRGQSQHKELDEIVKLVEAGSFKEAKPRLSALLKQATDDTLYNDAVNVALQHKQLRLKPKFRTRELRFSWALACEVPAGKRWVLQKSYGSSVGELKQFDRAGELKRKFTIRYFKSNTWYTLGPTKYDGSNVKGMALISEEDIKGAMLKIKRRSKLARRRLNRKIGSVQQFDIGGTGPNGDFLRFRTYIWKSKQRRWLTYRMWAIEYGDFKIDPAARVLMNSLYELKYEKKKK
ncbi:MAG: hypothetical protein O7C98_14285, partial [Planctomycetota bacterium]|nr:hypothetical protein [Planctomycetota bacterium]